MKKIILKISGMSCESCSDKITEKLKKVKGIYSAKVSFETKLAEIFYDEKVLKLSVIKDKIDVIGYKASTNKTSIKEIIPIIIGIVIIYLLLNRLFGFTFFNYIPKFDESTSIFMLFSIGMLTSVHCVSMCGAINIAASTSLNKSKIRPVFYNLGRIVSYTIIGGIIGGMGSIVSFNNTFRGLLILFTSILMLFMGLSMLGWIPNYFYKLFPKIKLNKYVNNNKSPFIIGLLNGFMPCGPLQIMHLYALSTGSILLGALSMFMFSLGTVPLMLIFGLFLTSLNKKHSNLIHKISSTLVIVLSILMVSRAFNYLDINLNKLFFMNYKNYEIAQIYDEYQYVEIDLEKDRYKPILVQKGIPLRFNIKVDIIQKYGCTSSIIIPKLNREIKLKNGDNYIEFTPSEVNNINYSCFMGMVSGNIKVVDDINKIKESMAQ